MNIKQAESLSGVSRRNIRYYEQAGLIRPARNPENDYREYSPEDIAALKLIRALRMVDMPLEQVKAVLSGDMDLRAAASAQRTRLAGEAARLETAMRFCTEMAQSGVPDVDRLLSRMEEPDAKSGLCRRWLEDYKLQAKAEREKVFTFLPDGPVTNAREFTDALLAYAREHDLDMTITKEGMYPEFTIGGVEYTAERLYATAYHVPVATIRCTAVHPEDFEPDLPAWKRRLLKLLHYSWLLIPAAIYNIDWIFRVGVEEVFTTLEGWLVLLSLVAISSTGVLRYYLLHYNENGKR